MDYEERTRHDINIGDVVALLEYALNTKKKRHIVGGVLLSVSFLFGGLALTAMTMKEEKNEQ